MTTQTHPRHRHGNPAGTQNMPSINTDLDLSDDCPCDQCGAQATVCIAGDHTIINRRHVDWDARHCMSSLLCARCFQTDFTNHQPCYKE